MIGSQKEDYDILNPRTGAVVHLIIFESLLYLDEDKNVDVYFCVILSSSHHGKNIDFLRSLLLIKLWFVCWCTVITSMGILSFMTVQQSHSHFSIDFDFITFISKIIQMHLSTQLELSKVFRSKGLGLAQFWPDFENSTSDWSKTLKRFRKKYSHQIFVKNVVLVGKQNCWGCLPSLKFYTQVN